MPRTKKDPALITMLDEQGKLLSDYERWYSRMKRAFNRLDALKRKLARLARKIAQHQATTK